VNKVLLIHPDLTYLGGAEKVLVNMIQALKEYNVTLLSSRKIDNVKWIKCKPFLLRHKRLRALQWIIYSNEINKIVQSLNSDYDIIIETQQVYINPKSNVFLINYLHYPYLIIPPPEVDNLIMRLYYLIQRLILIRRVRRINMVLTNSPFTSNLIKRELDIDSVVIYPPVNIQYFNSNIEWNNREDKVINIGTFIPFKNQIAILEVARLLPKIKFVLMGWYEKRDITYYLEIIKNKPKNVEVLLNVSENTLIKELRSSKLYIHLCPEHFGISIIEAISSGCVPIVYHLGGAKEIFGNLIHSWSNINELSEAIEILLNDEKLWRLTINNLKSKLTVFESEMLEKKIRDIISVIWRLKND